MTFRPQSGNVVCAKRPDINSRIYTSKEDAPEYVACKVNIGKVCIVIASVYFEPLTLITLTEFSRMIRKLGKTFVGAGDFNAHNPLWGSDRCDIRGDMIFNAAENLDLTVLNDGSATFLRGPK